MINSDNYGVKVRHHREDGKGYDDAVNVKWVAFEDFDSFFYLIFIPCLTLICKSTRTTLFNIHRTTANINFQSNHKTHAKNIRKTKFMTKWMPHIKGKKYFIMITIDSHKEKPRPHSSHFNRHCQTQTNNIIKIRESSNNNNILFVPQFHTPTRA